jgi:hypothetical protein
VQPIHYICLRNSTIVEVNIGQKAAIMLSSVLVMTNRRTLSIMAIVADLHKLILAYCQLESICHQSYPSLLIVTVELHVCLTPFMFCTQLFFLYFRSSSVHHYSRHLSIFICMPHREQKVKGHFSPFLHFTYYLY